MTKIHRYLTVALMAGALTFATASWAGECCKKAAEATKKGEACENCCEQQCCKEAAKKAAKEEGAAKECAKCAAKKKESEKSS